MQARKAKLIMILVLVLFVFFFSSDFGLIDVEKTSIITAIAVDKSEDGQYELTAQIAVPEATDTNSENLKAHISGKGSTVGGALKDLGDLSGWFPKLSFCNLIILGNSLAEDNVIKVLDYFAKTLRVQDSALVALAENTAAELLNFATPLDNISAFALQKIMLKNTGFDRDIVSTDVKTFCSGHYSSSGSAFMPIVKVVPAGKEPEGESTEGGNSGNNSSSGQGNAKDSGGDKNNLFNAKTTALFKDGIKVGELDENLTLTFNALTNAFKGTTFPVDGVEINGDSTNYLLTVLSGTPCVKLTATDDELTLNVSLTLYCKISDHSANGSEEALSQNTPLPKEVIDKAEKFFIENIEELIMTEKQTECDFLKIKEKLYRHNHEQYSRYKDNYLSVFKSNISVEVSGQK